LQTSDSDDKYHIVGVLGYILSCSRLKLCRYHRISGERHGRCSRLDFELFPIHIPINVLTQHVFVFDSNAASVFVNLRCPLSIPAVVNECKHNDDTTDHTTITYRTCNGNRVLQQLDNCSDPFWLSSKVCQHDHCARGFRCLPTRRHGHCRLHRGFTNPLLQYYEQRFVRGYLRQRTRCLPRLVVVYGD